MNAAEKLMQTINQELEEYSFVSITVTSICDKSQVSRPTFYHHFNSLADLVCKALNFRLAQDVYDFHTWNDWLNHIREALKYMQKNRMYFIHAFDRDVLRAGTGYFERLLGAYLQDRQKAIGYQLSQKEENFICGIYSGVIVSLFNEYIASDMTLDRDFLAFQFDSLLNGSIDRAIEKCKNAS